MAKSPNVAIIQHESGELYSFFSFLLECLMYLGIEVTQVAHHYFENGIAYFTRRINRCISMSEFFSLSFFLLLILAFF
jgi:hypothetical protein